MTRIQKKMVIPAVVGAAYAALTILLAPISYGPLQLRLSEALCVLPFYLPWTSVGLFLGCALANTMSAAGPLDIVFGSLATLMAGVCVAIVGAPYRKSGEVPGIFSRVLTCLLPVLWNGVVVGAVLAWTLTPTAFLRGALVFGGEVALGEAVVLFALGLPLLRWIPRLLKSIDRAGHNHI